MLARARRWLVAHRLVLAVGIVAAIPVIVSTVHALRAGWLPLGDDSIIAVRSHDVFSTHPPLLGQYSASSQVIGEPVLSPGPLLYWLLAVPVRLGRAAPIAAMALVNAACVVGVVGLAKRRGGSVFMFAAALAMVAVSASLDAPYLHDIWNPAAAIFPFTLLIFLAWSLACGEYRLLPLTALVASFTAQAQLTYVLPDLVLLAVGLGFLVASRPRIPRRWLVATLLVVAACWSFPALEEAVHRPGNVERMVQVATSGEPTLGSAYGWHSVVRAVGVPPWWLRPPQAPFARISDVVNAPGTGSTATAVAFFLALIGLAVAGARARRRDVLSAALLSLGLIVALGLVTTGTPSGHHLFAVISYTLWWASPAGMYCWLALGFGVVVLAASRLRIPNRAFPAPRVVLPTLGLLTVLAVAIAVAAGGKRDRLETAFEPSRAVARTVRESVRGAGPVLVSGVSGEGSFVIQSAIVYELRRGGTRFVVSSLPGIGTRYDPAKHPHDAVVAVYAGQAPAGAGRELARVRLDDFPADAPGPAQEFVVTLRRLR